MGIAAGIVNIHPLTDLIILIWYEMQDGTVDADFSNPVAAPPPTATELAVIVSVVKEHRNGWAMPA